MRRVLKLFAFAVLILLLVAFSIAAFLLYREAETSAYQARRLTELLQDVRWEMKSGQSKELRLSQAGPYDIRLGYNRLTQLLENLTKHGFQVQAQARVSPRMKELVEQGLFIPYVEKSQAGLEITAGNGEQLYRAIFPSRVYERFESIPSVVTDSLLFIENRDLLDLAHPKKKPGCGLDSVGESGAGQIDPILSSRT